MSTPPLFRHQQELLDRTKDLPAWGVLFEQGCGKSAPTIHTAVHLWREHKIDGVVVVAPNGVHRNWITDEVPKHCAAAWRGLDWHSDRGKAQDKAFAQLLEVKPSNGAFGTSGNQRIQELAWFAISYDGLMTPRGRDAVLRFKERYGRFMLVVDEGSRVKNPVAKRTQKVRALRQLAAYVRLLNGTPVGNAATDVYSQFQILDNAFWHQYGIASWTAFQARFCVFRKIVVGGDDDRAGDSAPRSRGPIVPHGATAEGVAAYEQLDLDALLASVEHDVEAGASVPPPRAATTGRTIEVVVGYRELDKLKEMIAPMSTRVTKEDAGLDLPPKLYSRLLFDLAPEQRRVYDELRREYMVELDNGALVTAPIAMVRILRLQQIACGYLPNPDDPERPKIFYDDDGRNPRLQLLLDRLEDTPHQGIIWARFTPDVDAICRALGPPRCARYDGEVSGKERERSLERFHAGKAKFIVAKVQSMGMGVTLVEAKSVFYYSNTFSLLDRLQSEDRCHRVGQTQSVSYYDLVAHRTVDEKLIKSFRENRDVANRVTGDAYREWLEA